MRKNEGLVKFIVLLVIAIIILGYFRVDIRQVVESLGAQANLAYVWGLLKTGWHQYLWPFLTNLWALVLGLIQKIRS
jgi:hypothetical protein